jgi:pyridoxal phosphate enzyme (YggS family)
MSEIALRFQEIQKQIALHSGGRAVEVVGVTKFQPLERLREGIGAGIKILGVNYAQEGEKFRAAVGDGVRWDFIGHIQSRKAKGLSHYDCIQSLDRTNVAEILNREAQGQGIVVPCLVEINIGEETQKSGVLPGNLESFLAEVSRLSYIKVVGFMGMPPALEPVEQRRPFFRKLKEIFDRYQPKLSLTTLSMGTSDDYLIAVDEGSTMVRLGTSLFGARPSAG